MLKSKKAFEAITFVETIKAPRQEYFAKFRQRDEEFYDKFLASDVSRQFAGGNPRFLVGMSGAELADTVVEAAGGTLLPKNDGTYTVSPEYWAGWALAYYQWLTRRSFAYMHRKGLGIKEVVAMYHPLHEADLSKFADAADSIVLAK